MLAPQLAFSSSGITAVSFGVQDADDPATSTAYAAWRTAGARLSKPRRVPEAQQVLGLAFDGDALELLTGNSPAGDACCSSTGVVRMTGGKAFGHAHTLERGLAGATVGELIVFSGRTLAALATERGVWVAQSSGSGRFGPVHLLTGSDARPEALRTAPLAAGGAIVAWTARDRHSSVPKRIFVAAGTAHSAPGGAHAVLSVPNSHRIDELAIVGDAASPGPGSPVIAGPSVAWVESWYDRRGAYRSQVALADLAHPRQVRSFVIPGTIASGLSFAGDARGDQLLAWKSCAVSGACAVREAVRRAGRRFAAPARLGSVDAAGAPVATLASGGEGLVGWVDQGHVIATALRPTAVRFGASHTVSATNYAADLTLGFGASGAAVAAWSQGTLAPDVVGAVYRPG